MPLEPAPRRLLNEIERITARHGALQDAELKAWTKIIDGGTYRQLKRAEELEQKRGQLDALAWQKLREAGMPRQMVARLKREKRAPAGLLGNAAFFIEAGAPITFSHLMRSREFVQNWLNQRGFEPEKPAAREPRAAPEKPAAEQPSVQQSDLTRFLAEKKLGQPPAYLLRSSPAMLLKKLDAFYGIVGSRNIRPDRNWSAFHLYYGDAFPEHVRKLVARHDEAIVKPAPSKPVAAPSSAPAAETPVRAREVIRPPTAAGQAKAAIALRDFLAERKLERPPHLLLRNPSLFLEQLSIFYSVVGNRPLRPDTYWGPFDQYRHPASFEKYARELAAQYDRAGGVQKAAAKVSERELHELDFDEQVLLRAWLRRPFPEEYVTGVGTRQSIARVTNRLMESHPGGVPAEKIADALASSVWQRKVTETEVKRRLISLIQRLHAKKAF